MQTSLSNLVDNLSEIYSNDCKGCKEREKIKSMCDSIRIKNKKLYYKCKECNKRSLNSISRLFKKYPIRYQFCNGHIDKFILLLRVGVYLYEHMDRWENHY